MIKKLFLWPLMLLIVACSSDLDKLALDGDFYTVSRPQSTSIGFTTIYAVCHNGMGDAMLETEAEQMCLNAKNPDSLPYTPHLSEDDYNHPVIQRLWDMCTQRYGYLKADLFSCD